MLTAITRAVSRAIVNCELTFLERNPIDLEKAREQHRAYEKLLEKFGVRVISLPEEPALPDSMFVEDPAIVLDELAVILPLGTASRQPEAASLAKALEPFRKLEYITAPGKIEGGDILHIGRKVFVGISSRTNAEGIGQLAKLLHPYDYEVIGVPVTGCLHLKSAVTYIGRTTLLANRNWFDSSAFANYQWVDVAVEEPHAANALAFGDDVILPAAFPLTRGRLAASDFRVTPIDIRELQKAESGLTCSSLLFDDFSWAKD